MLSCMVIIFLRTVTRTRPPGSWISSVCLSRSTFPSTKKALPPSPSVIQKSSPIEKSFSFTA
jgi:hypothetical protein